MDNRFGNRYAHDMLIRNLVCSYRFDEPSDTSRFDHSGNNFRLTDNNSVPTVTAGVPAGLGYAADFTLANSEYLNTPFNVRLNPTNNVVVSMWVNLKTKATLQFLASQYNFGSAPDRAWFILYSNASDLFALDTSFVGVGTPSGISTGVWYHLVAWYESGVGAGIRMNAGTTSLASNSTIALNATTRDLCIGATRNNSNSNATQYTDGSIAGFNMWKPTTNQLKWLAGPGAEILYNGGQGLQIPTPY